MVPKAVKIRVQTIMIFRPKWSARIDKIIRPATLPTNYDDIIEPRKYLLSQ